MLPLGRLPWILSLAVLAGWPLVSDPEVEFVRSLSDAALS